MTDEEWVDFYQDCENLEYSHPSGVAKCLEQRIGSPELYFIPRYDKCDQDSCPVLKRI